MADQRFLYSVASSLDGLIADADDGLDWLLDFGFDEFQARYERFLAGVGAIAMGASTYEFVLRSGEPWTYDLPTFVFTHRELPLPTAADRGEGGFVEPDIRFVSGDVGARVDALRAAAAGRHVWVMGGGPLAAQFHAAGALDELHLTVMPVALGSGRPLLPVGGATGRLRLEELTRFDSGAVELRYALPRA